MKTQKKKAALTMLLSVALLSSNVGAVYAQEAPVEKLQSEQNAPVSAPEAASTTETSAPAAETAAPVAVEAPAAETAAPAPEASAPAAVETPTTETTVPTAPEQSSTDSKETTDAPVTAAKEETTTKQETTAEQTTPATDTKTAETEQSATTEGTTTDTNTAEDSTEKVETPAASENETTASFINKAGEEVDPVSLIGQDYNAISEGYDGETNVVKKYAASDTDAADTIMDSYIDENGNLVMIISQGAAKKENTEEKTETNPIAAFFGLGTESGSSENAPAVDGSFSGWEDVPVSYEYNWNKSDAWVDNVHYTETNSTDVRHGMQMYTDGENVYLNIVFAREFSTGQKANGNDYQFWVDGQMAAYQVEWADGTSLSYSDAAPGTYPVDVRHRDSSWSYVLTEGAVAYYHVNEGNLNNQLELKIPLDEFVKQNGNINLDNYSMIQFFTPNLMSDRISVAGSSSGAVPFAVVVFLAVPVSYIWLKKRNEGEVAFA